MKTLYVLLTGFILYLPLTLRALPPERFRTTDDRIAVIRKNLAMGLRSGNEGLMESSLMMTARLRMRYPFRTLPELLAITDSLSSSSPSAPLRFKAYLVSSIFADPQWFAQDTSLETNIPEQFYTSAARRHHEKMLGMNSF